MCVAHGLCTAHSGPCIANYIYPPSLGLEEYTGIISTNMVQGALGPSGVHSASRCGLQRDFQSSGEACYSAHSSLFGSLSVLARAPTQCQECISSWHFDRDRLLQPASRVCGLQLSGYGLPVEQLPIWFEAGSSGMVLSVCHLPADPGVC
jgi:hypothetical protein